MYFRKNSESKESFKLREIKTALNDLNILVDDKNREAIYLFRSVPLIRDFVEVHIDNCDADLRAAILKLLEKIKASGEGYEKLPRSQKGETRELRKAMSEVLNVIRFA